jgi:hypothetical protein
MIAGIYLITIDDAMNKLQMSQPHPHTLIYELMYNSSAYISGIGHAMMNFTHVHPILDNEKLRQQRFNIIKSLITTTPIYEVRGGVDQIAKHISGETV